MRARPVVLLLSAPAGGGLERGLGPAVVEVVDRDAGRVDPIDAVEDLAGEDDIGRGDLRFEVLDRARPDDRRGDSRVVEHECERELAGVGSRIWRDAGADRSFSGDLLLPRLGHVVLGASRWRPYSLPVPGRASERVLRDVGTPDRCEGPELRGASLKDVPVTDRSPPGVGR